MAGYTDNSNRQTETGQKDWGQPELHSEELTQNNKDLKFRQAKDKTDSVKKYSSTLKLFNSVIGKTFRESEPLSAFIPYFI